MTTPEEFAKHDPQMVEEAFREIADVKQCGSLQNQIEQGALANFPMYEQILALIAAENEARGITPHDSVAMNIGARAFALTMAKLAKKTV